MSAPDTYSEQYRRECEARHWLRSGYQDAATVDELMQRIEKKRGSGAAAELRQEMRRQWARRREWMDPGSAPPKG